MKNVRTNSEDEDKALRTMASICPYRNQDEFTNDNFSLQDDTTDNGWFFECRICKGAKCTGYIKK